MDIFHANSMAFFPEENLLRQVELTSDETDALSVSQPILSKQ